MQCFSAPQVTSPVWATSQGCPVPRRYTQVPTTETRRGYREPELSGEESCSETSAPAQEIVNALQSALLVCRRGPARLPGWSVRGRTGGPPARQPGGRRSQAVAGRRWVRRASEGAGRPVQEGAAPV